MRIPFRKTALWLLIFTGWIQISTNPSFPGALSTSLFHVRSTRFPETPQLSLGFHAVHVQQLHITKPFRVSILEIYKYLFIGKNC